MADATTTEKEVFEAELTADDLNSLAEGWDNVELEGENVIVRLSTSEISLSDRMEAVKRAHSHVYDEARRELGE